MRQLCLTALLSHWLRKPLQLLSLITGLAVATALWTSVQAINAEARASYDAAAAMLSDGQYDQLLPRQGNSISQATYIQLRRAGWLVSPILDGQIDGIRLIGFERLTAPKTLQLATSTAQADAFKKQNIESLFANAETVARFSTSFTMVIDAAIAPATIVGDIGIVQRTLQRDDLSRLLVLPLQPIGQASLDQVAPELRLQPARQTADLTQLTQSFHLNLTAFGLLSFAVGLFIVYSTVGLAFEQRREVINTLRTLGVSLRLMISVLALEVLLLGAIGAILGIIIGYFIAAALLPDVAATLHGLYGAHVASSLLVRSEWWLSGVGIAILGIVLAFADRIWQIVSTPLSAHTRSNVSANVNHKKFKVFGFISLTLFSSMVPVSLFIEGLLSGFFILASLLIGAAFALPILATLTLTGLERHTRNPIFRWFLADTRYQLPSLNLALMALLLAISANIGVSTMVSSFRLTFSAFLDQRLAPELYVEVDDRPQSHKLAAYLKLNKIESLPLLSTIQEIDEEDVHVNGISVGPTYRQNWKFLRASDNPWDRVQSGSAVIINEQLARRANLWVGDTVTLSEIHVLPIAAIVGDYGNPNAEVIASASLIRSIEPHLYAVRFGIRTNDVEALQNELISILSLSPAQMIDQATLKAMSMELFDRTFIVTGALNTLTLGVAGFSLLMSLLTLADLRIPQLAPAWALGLEWRRLSIFELGRALILTAFVWLCAAPLGIGLAWILLNVVNVQAFGWQLPMFLFPSAYLQLGVYSLLAVFLATIWPTYRLARIEPSTLLKVFANER